MTLASLPPIVVSFASAVGWWEFFIIIAVIGLSVVIAALIIYARTGSWPWWCNLSWTGWR